MTNNLIVLFILYVFVCSSYMWTSQFNYTSYVILSSKAILRYDLVEMRPNSGLRAVTYFISQFCKLLQKREY